MPPESAGHLPVLFSVSMFPPCHRFSTQNHQHLQVAGYFHSDPTKQNKLFFRSRSSPRHWSHHIPRFLGDIVIFSWFPFGVISHMVCWTTHNPWMMIFPLKLALRRDNRALTSPLVGYKSYISHYILTH